MFDLVPLARAGWAGQGLRQRPRALVFDLSLAPRNAKGEVDFSADFYMIKPVDPAKSNGRILFEIGNRGGKSALLTFQKAKGSPDPTTEEEFGDGALMNQGPTSVVQLGERCDTSTAAAH